MKEKFGYDLIWLRLSQVMINEEYKKGLFKIVTFKLRNEEDGHLTINLTIICLKKHIRYLYCDYNKYRIYKVSIGLYSDLIITE